MHTAHFRALAPGLCRYCFFLLCPSGPWVLCLPPSRDGFACLRTCLAARSFLGDLPPIDLRAVCLTLTMACGYVWYGPCKGGIAAYAVRAGWGRCRVVPNPSMVPRSLVWHEGHATYSLSPSTLILLLRALVNDVPSRDVESHGSAKGRRCTRESTVVQLRGVTIACGIGRKISVLR